MAAQIVICEICDARAPVAPRIRRYVRLWVAGQFGHLEDRVPVARGAAQPQGAFDHRSSQLGVADGVRIAGVEAAWTSGDLLGPLDLAAQDLDVRGLRFAL